MNVGMSRTTYSSYESDTQRPSVDVFPALARFLNVTTEELLVLYGTTVIAALRPLLEKVLEETNANADASEVNGAVLDSDKQPETVGEVNEDRGTDSTIVEVFDAVLDSEEELENVGEVSDVESPESEVAIELKVNPIDPSWLQPVSTSPTPPPTKVVAAELFDSSSEIVRMAEQQVKQKKKKKGKKKKGKN